MKRKTETWVVRRPIYIGTDDANEHQEDLELFGNEEIAKVEQLLLDNRIIAVNHWDTGDLSTMNNVEEIYQCIHRHISEKDERRLFVVMNKKIAQALWKFVHDVLVGDVIVLPLENGKHAIGTVEGEYEYRKISSIVAHTRRVRWLRTDATIDAKTLRTVPSDRLIDTSIRKLTEELPNELLEGNENSDIDKNHVREKYLGLACKECDDPKHQICPSCDMRYEKLVRIDRLIDGTGDWDDFADTAEKRRLRKK